MTGMPCMSCGGERSCPPLDGCRHVANHNKQRPDKRKQCGCHRECPIARHNCAVPCRWPDCLTEDEHRELLEDLEDEGAA